MSRARGSKKGRSIMERYPKMVPSFFTLVKQHNKYFRQIGYNCCSTCGLIQEISAFYVRHDGYPSGRCKACNAVVDKTRKRGVGLHLVRFEMNCAICGTSVDGRNRHSDHTVVEGTKVIRGILCSPCNTGLGLFRDDVARLQSAINYLNQFEQQQTRVGTQ